ncbi:MAG: hypothetical protein ACNYPH_02760 [Gammaproteobacteria bacterium WSBS_2016_MAG_OTU1]
MANSKVYADHVAAFKMFADYVAAHGDTYGFSFEEQAEFATELVSLNSAYDNYTNTAELNRITIEVMRRRYDETDRILRFQRLRLKISAIDLPTEAMEAFGVRVDSDMHEDDTPIDFAPENVIQQLVHLVSRLMAFDSRKMSHHPIGKSANVQGIAIWVAYVTSDSQAPSRDQYKILADAGRPVFNVTHSPDKIGMVCYVITAYRNRQGLSPESKPVVFPVF